MTKNNNPFLPLRVTRRWAISRFILAPICVSSIASVSAQDYAPPQFKVRHKIRFPTLDIANREISKLAAKGHVGLSDWTIIVDRYSENHPPAHFPLLALLPEASDNQHVVPHPRAKALGISSNAVFLEMFGAHGDGVRDDTSAFIAFREVFQDRDHLIQLHLLSDRHYTYWDNKWAYGIKSLRVLGNGAQLECINKATFSIDNNVINFNNWASNHAESQRTGARNLDFGHRIASAKAGSSRVSLMDGNNITDYKSGSHVLLSGFINQSVGAPPDFRYFEYSRIDSISLEDGVVTLKAPLKHDYSSDWPIFVSQRRASGVELGPARILCLNRPKRKLTHYLELRDLRLTPNRNEPLKCRLTLLGALNFRLINVDASQLVETTIGSAERVEARNCSFSDVEGDKILTSCMIDNCSMENVLQFVGTDSLVIRNSKIRGPNFVVAPRSAKFEAVHYEGPGLPSGRALMLPNYYNERFVRSIIFSEFSAKKNLPVFAGNTVFQVQAKYFVQQGALIFSKSDLAGWNFIYEGRRIASRNGENRGTVNKIRELSDKLAKIDVTWDGYPPKDNVPLYVSTNPILVNDSSKSFAPVERFEDDMKISLNSIKSIWDWSKVRRFFLLARISRIDIDVKIIGKLDIGWMLVVRDIDRNSELLEIDLTRAGRRTLQAEKLIGAKGRDRYLSGFSEHAVAMLEIRAVVPKGFSLRGSAAKFPFFDLSVQAKCIV